MGGHGRWRDLVRLSLATIAIAVIWAMTPAWLALLVPSPSQPRDFFQDYASARNWLTGRPIYMHQAETMSAYLGLDVPARDVNIAYNAHPPTSVLLALPLAGFDYVTAGWWWNVGSLSLLLASLALMAWQLGWRPRVWGIPVMLALLMTWVPLWLHMLQGQLGLVLLALMTSAWVAGRQSRSNVCGILIGLAASIKLFPILLISALITRQQWRGVWSAFASLLVATVVTLMALGVDAYVTYATVVLPNLDRWRPDWINASLIGFFARLFAPDAATLPLLANPPLATLLTALGGAAIAVLALIIVRRARPDFDATFGLVLTAMLLLSALTWAHYFVVLLLPLAIWVRRLTLASRPVLGRWVVLAATWGLMAAPQLNLAHMVVPGGAQGVATPLLAATVLSLNFYGLVGFFGAQLWWLHADAMQAAEPTVPGGYPWTWVGRGLVPVFNRREGQ